jgi:hypothetical protein
VEGLDDAFDRVSALDFAVPNPFVNHGPMACEALVALGREGELDAWVRGFESSMGEAVRPVDPAWPSDFDWAAHLGQPHLLPEWMGWFGRSIGDDGWRSVVEVWVPRLAPGLAAALFHGVIRTAHSVRTIDALDTPSRRAELARALGNWAVWFAPGHPPLDPPAGDPGRTAARAAADGAGCYVEAPNIFFLHGVTGAMAVHLLLGHLSPSDGAAAVGHLLAEHDALYAEHRALDARDIAGSGGPGAPGDEVEWTGTVEPAAASHDPHQVKLVEACRRGNSVEADGRFLHAARVVTGVGT